MDARSLADDLAAAREADVVRLVADWMDRARRSDEVDLDVEPPLSGVRHRDALVAAATAQVARWLDRPTPRWTIGQERTCPEFWYPGPPSLYANALVHAPGEFAARGLFIEAESLACV